jgi:(E)-4-hydroxy-3-methylbut-2-enyl-diphosphate synthase
MIIVRRKTREINLGNLKIGGTNPVIVQSMIKNRLEDMNAVREEIRQLQYCGCEIIRVAIVQKDSIAYLKNLLKSRLFIVPVVADIQFDYSLAIEALKTGVECVRINPGNIGGTEKVEKIVNEAKKRKAAIRIGVNSGSIDKRFLRKSNGNHLEAMIYSTLDTINLFEKIGFFNFKISAKASSVMDTVSAYQVLSEKVDYPLHLGVTEAGPLFSGSIKSATGIGILLSMGIGDTIRFSLTDVSLSEVRAAYTILSCLGLRKYGMDIISCPTCSRTKIDLKSVVEEVEGITNTISKNIKIAIMGCIVNGPGEAKEADLGIAFGKEKAAIFRKGKIIKRVESSKAIEEFKKELNNFII